MTEHADIDRDWYQNAIGERWRGGEALIPQDWINGSSDPVAIATGDEWHPAKKHTRKCVAAFRSDMKYFGSSCFHRASTWGANANAAPEGGA